MTQKSYEHQPPDFTVKWHCTLAHSYSLGDGAKAFIYQRKAIGPGTVTHRGPDSIVAVYIFKNEKLSWLSYLISLELKTTQTKSHTKLIRKTRCLWSIFGKRKCLPLYPHPKVYIKTLSKFPVGFRGFTKTNTERFFFLCKSHLRCILKQNSIQYVSLDIQTLKSQQLKMIWFHVSVCWALKIYAISPGQVFCKVVPF